MKKNKIDFLSDRVSLSFGLLLMLLLGLLLHPFSCGQPAYHPPAFSAKQFKRQQDSLAVRYEDRIRRLQHHSDSLSQQLKEQQKQLTIARQQAALQRIKIQQRIGKQVAARDTLQKLINCDSLTEEVQAYLRLSDQRDSISQTHIQDLNLQLGLKDSALTACATYARQLNLLTDASITGQQQLEQQVKTLTGQLKRKQGINKVLTAGVLILSGAILTQMIH